MREFVLFWWTILFCLTLIWLTVFFFFFFTSCELVWRKCLFLLCLTLPHELVWRKCLFFLCLTLLNMNWYEVFVLFLFNFTSSELVWSKYLFFFFFSLCFFGLLKMEKKSVSVKWAGEFFQGLYMNKSVSVLVLFIGDDS